jgi:uroporphyrinogen decarboxylase
MTAMERALAAMAHREPDRVPLFLLTTLHGARELGLGLREYFSSARHVIEGQLRLLARYRGDCVTPSCGAVAEAEAFGAEAIYRDDGPPNAGPPPLRPEDVEWLTPPRVQECPSLVRGLEVIRGLAERVKGAVPIMGSVISPFSLPIMQLGFERYLQLLHDQPSRFARLMAVNEVFCVEWANAQLAAGATAVGYADPMSSTTIIPRPLYLRTGHLVARETLPRIRGAVAIHLASGRGLALAPDLIATGAAAVGVSALEDLADWKSAVRGRMTVVGNLNGLEMRRWTAEQAEAAVKRAIAGAGRGGGFVLSDNHGEIPWQVPDAVLLAIRDAVDRWGRYPLAWVGETA